MNGLSSTPYPPKIVMAYRRGHGKSTYRFTTSAQCHGTKTGSVPDCSALRYWESVTEGEWVSVISGARIETLEDRIHRKDPVQWPESGWVLVVIWSIGLKSHKSLGGTAKISSLRLYSKKVPSPLGGRGVWRITSLSGFWPKITSLRSKRFLRA